MLLKIFEIDKLKRRHMRGFEYDLRSPVVEQCFLPALHAKAPAIAFLQARESIFRNWRAQVVSNRCGELKKLVSHHTTDEMQTDILRAGVATAVAKETGDR